MFWGVQPWAARPGQVYPIPLSELCELFGLNRADLLQTERELLRTLDWRVSSGLVTALDCLPVSRGERTRPVLESSSTCVSTIEVTKSLQIPGSFNWQCNICICMPI